MNDLKSKQEQNNYIQTIIRHSFQQPSKPYASKSKCVRWRWQNVIAHVYKNIMRSYFRLHHFRFYFSGSAAISRHRQYHHLLFFIPYSLSVPHDWVELTIFSTIRLIRFLLICNFIANVLPLNVCNPKIVAKMKWTFCHCHIYSRIHVKWIYSCPSINIHTHSHTQTYTHTRIATLKCLTNSKKRRWWQFNQLNITQLT